MSPRQLRTRNAHKTAFRCKSPERFKPGWRSKRREDAIGQAQARHEISAKREERKAKHAPLRMERLQERENLSGVHPLTGTLRAHTTPKNPYDGVAGTTVRTPCHKSKYIVRTRFLHPCVESSTY